MIRITSARLERVRGFALIFGATLIAYLPALRGGVVWDDNAHLTSPALRSLGGLWRIWTELGVTQQYYPLLHSAFWFEHQLWGDATLCYHVLNVALHSACALLVVMIMRRMSLPGAWLGGVIYALHPVCVEAVAWMSEQKSTLSGVLYLASAYIYLDFDETRRQHSWWAAFALFLLSLMTKSVTATLPAALLVIFWWKRGSLALKRDVLPLAPWFAAGISAGIFTSWVERTIIKAQGADYNLSLLQRTMLAGHVAWFYFLKILWPVHLIFIYPHWTIDPRSRRQYVWLVMLIAVGIGLAAFARRTRGPLAAFLFFIGTLFPALGFLNVYPFRFSYVADHFQYIAMLGVIVPVASLLARYLGSAERTLFMLGLGVICGTLTFAQSRQFQSAETLYRTTLARNPFCWMCHNNLGVILMNEPGRREEAGKEFLTSIQLRPKYGEAMNNLGLLFIGDPRLQPKAFDAFARAAQMDPELGVTHENMGTILSREGKTREAIEEFRKAVKITPGDPSAHYDLALTLMTTPGGMDEALDEAMKARKLDPSRQDIHDLALQLGDVE